jgi:hypothetical protein
MSIDLRKPTISRLINLVVYKVKKGQDAEFRRLLEQHWPTLDRLGLVTKDPPQIWRGENIRSASEGSSWVELFTWKEETGSDVAHQSPEVMKIWEPMTPLLEGMDILYLEPAKL